MDGGAVRGALALGSAVLLALTGCAPSSDTIGPQIVAQVRIDQNGEQVPPPATPGAPARPAGDGNAVCPPLSLATMATLSGPDAALGIGVRNGIQMAVDEHNSENPGCQIQLKTVDTEGDLDKARQQAAHLVRDAFTLGMIGPGFTGEAAATGDIFDRAGMVAPTASATGVALAEAGWRTFFRGLANDGVQGTAVANYMRRQLGSTAVCVVDDGTDYGRGLARAVRETLGGAADPGCAITVDPAADELSAPVDAIRDRAPDSVFFAGHYAQAATLVRGLRDAGVGAHFVSADAAKDREFVIQAGAAASNAVLSCPCGPEVPTFAAAYTEKFGEPPGTFSAGAYDLGTILLNGIDSGARTRAALLDFVRHYHGHGLEREYRWAENGELITPLIWIYRVQ